MRRRLLSLGCAVTVLLSLAVTAPASAATGTYCMLNISTGASRCASTEAELYSGATALATQYLLGRFFDDNGRTGAFLDIFAAGPCDTNSDKDWQYSNIGTAWNDRVSSFTGYSQCQIKIFENDNVGGASLGPLSYSDYVGAAMNDRTTSMQFF
jgi:hypothetical protein